VRKGTRTALALAAPNPTLDGASRSVDDAETPLTPLPDDRNSALSDTAPPMSSGSTDLVSLKDLKISYSLQGSEFVAVSGISFGIKQGEFVSVVGPSGCGKSTLLACLAGLVAPSKGIASYLGAPISGPDPTRAVVFQSPCLLPWRDVARNIAFGLQARRPRIKPAEISERVGWALTLVGLEKFAHAYPGQLSGGMQQRVNLARALVMRPSVLLLDEPFAAVDALTRERLQAELERIWLETKTTAVFVTHDVTEAVALADRVMVMSPSPGQVRTVVKVPYPRPRLSGIAVSDEIAETAASVRAHLFEPEQPPPL
jgi:NitT/TauT family transport system ATP-binding protein